MEKLLTIIDGPILTSCRFERRSTPKKKKGPLPVQLSSKSTVMLNDKKGEVIIRFSVRSDTPGVPFKFNVEMEAFYNTVKKLSAKEIDKAGQIEVDSLLFAVIRDFIAELTRKAGLKPFWMDYIDFSKAKEKRVMNRIASKEKTKPAKSSTGH